MTLETRAWRGVLFLGLFTAGVLFFSAGSLHYWQGWLYLSVLLGAIILHTLYLIRHDRALLERRLKGGVRAESRLSQKIIMSLLSLGFIALIVVPGLDQRFHWSFVPPVIVLAGDLLTIIGFYIIFLVFKENTFSATTVVISHDHKVISTGPYAIARHPMYAVGLLYLLGVPFALASYPDLIVFILLIPFLLWRISDEESLLTKDLKGYAEYMKRVRWRLLPGIF